MALLCGALLAVGALDTPVSNLRPALKYTDERTGGRRVTPELYSALTWVRDHTSGDAVLAANNATPTEFNYSAFAERRLFLGGWGFSQRTREAGYESPGEEMVNPFAERLALNTAALTRADAAGLEALRRGGVSYLVIDHVNGYAVDLAALQRHARVVYQRPGVTILELRPRTA